MTMTCGRSYEYLSAIPCIDTVIAGQPQLRNVCH